jgi:hydrogenase expression/formation protein HypC
LTNEQVRQVLCRIQGSLKLYYTKYERLIMCLAIPARIVELDGDVAVVDAMGNRYKAKTTLLPEAKLGDLVLVHAGFAISLVDEEEAKKTWQLIAEINEFQETQNKVSG